MTADEFNSVHPVGARVRYWPGVRTGEGASSQTRTPAWNIAQTPVVSVEGYPGGIALTHVEPLTEAEKA